MSELTQTLPVERIGASGTAVTVCPDDAQRAALARRMMLPAIAALTCRWSLRTGPGGTVEAEGHLAARVTQVCIVTSEPFEADVAEDFTVQFVLQERLEDADELDLDAADEIVYDGVTVDLGEATAEQLALALDPYPRKPGAVLEGGGSETGPNAFAQLAALRKP